MVVEYSSTKYTIPRSNFFADTPMRYQVKSGSPIGAYFAASLAGPRKKSLDTAHEFRSRDLEDFCKLKDCCERGAVQPALQQTYVFRMIATLEGERFLCEMPLLAELAKRSCKRPFLGRRIFFSSWHLLAGVCDVSMNTSTKYSIRSVGHSRGGKACSQGKTESAGGHSL